jgi:hypothetical protein
MTCIFQLLQNIHYKRVTGKIVITNELRRNLVGNKKSPGGGPGLSFSSTSILAEWVELIRQLQKTKSRLLCVSCQIGGLDNFFCGKKAMMRLAI